MEDSPMRGTGGFEEKVKVFIALSSFSAAKPIFIIKQSLCQKTNGSPKTEIIEIIEIFLFDPPDRFYPFENFLILRGN